ncbi:MAG: RNA-binding cell elongation regulator Jag/EloR [Actinomycetota bacterium]|nr:RNA-binding cell elongation regulator Jag/EloR [Actinomycetota bacterium]
MSKATETEAETTEEAIGAALEELGAERDQVEVEILEEPNKGLLGLRKARARVRVTVLDGEDVAKTAVEGLLAKMGVDGTVTTHRDGDELWLTIGGDSLAWLIGHHGYTLDALQVLVQAMVSRQIKSPARLVLDIEDYRARRKREIKSLAERTIGTVLARNEAISMRPMNAYERKIVHLVVGEYEGVASISTGVDPNRFVIITPA